MLVSLFSTFGRLLLPLVLVRRSMVRSTQVARVSDSLPLAQSVDEDQSPELTQCKQQAKIIFRKITPQSETRCSIDTGSLSMQYVRKKTLMQLPDPAATE